MAPAEKGSKNPATFDRLVGADLLGLKDPMILGSIPLKNGSNNLTIACSVAVIGAILLFPKS